MLLAKQVLVYQSKMRLIGVDVGGTFTDIIITDIETGELAVYKVSSTPESQVVAVVEGIIREIQLLNEDCTFSIQSERRNSRPWSIGNAEPSIVGRNMRYYNGRDLKLQAKSTIKAPPGAVIRIYTHGGGWKQPSS